MTRGRSSRKLVTVIMIDIKRPRSWLVPWTHSASVSVCMFESVELNGLEPSTTSMAENRQNVLW